MPWPEVTMDIPAGGRKLSCTFPFSLLFPKTTEGNWRQLVLMIYFSVISSNSSSSLIMSNVSPLALSTSFPSKASDRQPVDHLVCGSILPLNGDPTYWPSRHFRPRYLQKHRTHEPQTVVPSLKRLHHSFFYIVGLVMNWSMRQQIHYEECKCLLGKGKSSARQTGTVPREIMSPGTTSSILQVQR